MLNIKEGVREEMTGIRKRQSSLEKYFLLELSKDIS